MYAMVPSMINIIFIIIPRWFAYCIYILYRSIHLLHIYLYIASGYTLYNSFIAIYMLVVAAEQGFCKQSISSYKLM